MDVIYVNIFEWTINLFESYLMIDFESKFNEYRFSGIKRNVCFAIAVIISFLGISVSNYLNMFIEIPSYICIVIMILYGLVALNGSFVKKILSCMIFNVIMTLTSSFSLFIYGMIFNVGVDKLISEFGIYRFVCVITTKIALFYISRIILRLKISKIEKIPNSTWIAITVIPLLTIFIMVTITETAIYNNDTRITFYLFLSIVGLILTNAIFYYLFGKLGEEYGIITENTLLKTKLELQRKHSIETKELYKEIQNMRHDMKNQLIGIRAYYKNESYEKGINHINTLIDNIDVTKKFIFTNNDMLNTIVNSKFSEANLKGVKTYYNINYDFDDKMDDADINILFGNLMDNAIEACENLEIEKEIKLLIDKKRDYILIEISNTIATSVLISNPDLTTSKNDKLNHGIGIRSIRKVLQKYNGILNYQEKGNMLYCNILLLEEKIRKNSYGTS